MTSAPHTEHGAEDLCPAGTRLHESALREGHMAAPDATDAPCLTGLGPLRPAPDDAARLEPVAPVVAPHGCCPGRGRASPANGGAPNSWSNPSRR
ncbi:hypothetical protein OHB00_27745 [Streptomyces sp. NBC_00631]|uniref:hypothetical protein n=1 Tax=Streptomyces sp. NBC_00631 TaxID=2975793 RepID=UPI0030E5B9CF